ncbi:hypothetical protein REPUB_Repub04eG0195300 [Reevesia pubescens]
MKEVYKQIYYVAFCGDGMEDWQHALFTCIFSRDVWKALYPWILDFFDNAQIDNTLWSGIFSKETEMQHLSALFYGLWCLWYNKTNVFHNHTCQLAKSVVERVKHFVASRARVGQNGHTTAEESCVWSPLMWGVVKINVDASMIFQSHTTSLGAVIRDFHGMILLSGISVAVYVFDHFHAKIFWSLHSQRWLWRVTAIWLSLKLEKVKLPCGIKGALFMIY